MSIEVTPYNPDWVKWFHEIKSQIWPHISDLVLDVVHVGSTSINGMSAKPIIDIDIVTKNLEELDEIISRIKRIGYTHQGDLGIKGREAFKLDYEHKHKHNLYLVAVDSLPYRNHVLLKRHLEENPDSFKRYNDLKLSLADSVERCEEYWKAKTELILEFLEAEGLPQEELELILIENM